jgi:outer membrane receptor protein involved in Fe transport
MRAKTNIGRTAISIAVATLFASPFTLAQDNAADSGKRLPSVEVVGTSPLPGIGIEKNKLPYDVQTVTDEQIYNGQSLNLSEYMSRNLLGVNINEIQGSPFQADINYRGFRASGILGSAQGLSVYLDGVRVNEPFGDVVNWDMIPEAAISNVTLVPGSNPVYGLNTLGGALAFTTKSGLTAPGTEVKLQAGSFGRKRADVSYGSKSDDGSHRFISATAFDEKGWRDYSEGSVGNVFAKIGRMQNDSNWSLSLIAARSNMLGNGLLPSTNYGPEGEDAPQAGLYETNRRWVYTHPDQTKNELNMLTLSVQRMLANDTELAGMTYLRHSTRRSVNGDYEADDGDAVINYNNTWQTSYGGSVNLTKLMDKHQITTGTSFDASNVRYTSSQADCDALDASRAPINCGIPDPGQGVRGKSYALGFYASDTWKFQEQTHLTAAARFNHAGVSNTITGQAKEAFTYNSLNPSAGISHQLNSAMNLFANLGQSNRVPTVMELGCADPANPCSLPTGLQADPYLKQVIARTIEGGMRWKLASDAGASVSVYRSENRDDIIFIPSNIRLGRGYFKNFSRTRRQGLDLSAYKTMGTVTVQAGYSYLDATYQTDDLIFGGERDIRVKPGTKIAGLPEHTLKLNADWRVTPKFTLGGTAITTSRITTQGNEDGIVGLNNADNAPANAKVNGYTIFHLHANYAAEKGLDYFGRINNLFDTRYETYGMMALSAFDASGTNLVAAGGEANVSRFVAPGAPRSFMVGLRYRY